jgi:NitT/TauT family transport system substrate-binding protein
VLATFKKPLQDKQIDLSKTYTTAFVDAAAKTLGAAN